ncbi:hypothetical protein G7070_06520 [Propioniciclava coleopterorum]|uniref:Uncharacterized protein n=1 Tax=Propioniciclava coleopterorum TaxID=2714937 RepID=A0A6G7Y5T0_9ACTN|nr:hypothetical protein [Propioniciclava coleopterorum]QIK71981.1 hypothetical protein G7070_06520 [Propioniciclava coleopterorum]
MSEAPRRPFFTIGTPMKYALILAAIFMLPIVNSWLKYGGTITDDDLMYSAIASLVLVNPLAVIVVGAVYAWRHGFSATAPLLFGIAFLPAALVAYNETALPYALAYVAFGYLGEGIGLGLKRLRSAVRAR